MKCYFFAIMLMAAGLGIVACNHVKLNGLEINRSENTQGAEALQNGEEDGEATNEKISYNDEEGENEDTFISGVDNIRMTWKEAVIQVSKPGEKVDIKTLTHAFVKMFPFTETNLALKKWLDSPEYAKQNDFHTHVKWINDPSIMVGCQINCELRSGYIRGILDTQTDRSTTTCYWNRKDGHKLFAAFVEDCSETPNWDNLLLVTFDYDPATGKMTADTGLPTLVERHLKGYDFYSITLPEEGKNILLSAIKLEDPEAPNGDISEAGDFTIEWDGQTFSWRE